MLNIQAFTFNAFQENTYLIINGQKQCWVVDPGMYGDEEVAQLTEYMDSNKLIPQAIINTHAHIDHIFGVQAIIDKYNIPFAIHDLETPVLSSAYTSAMLFGFTLAKVPQPTFFIKENVPLMLGEESLEVRLAPGHSPGSIAFYYAPGKWVIGGDVLFSGSIGRSDLPGGNHETLLASIRSQFFTLPDDTVVFSGHGPATSIGEEKKYNTFLQ